MKRGLLICLAMLGTLLVPPGGATATDTDPPDRVDRVDLYVVLDRSGSMSAEITAVKNNLATVVRSLQCPPLGTGSADTCIPDLWAGAGTVGYAGSGADAFHHYVDVSPTPSFTGIPTSEPSGCCQEPLTFAVHASVTGEGGAAYGLSGVPARTSCGSSPAAGAGYATFGYPCFREGAFPVVLLVTDEAPLDPAADTYKTPSWSAVVRPAMVARGARLAGVTGDGASPATTQNLQLMAGDTRALDADRVPVVVPGGGSNAPAAIQSAVLRLVSGTVPPFVALTAPAATFQLASEATLEWAATDGNGLGLAFHDVRYREAAYDGDFGAPVYPSQWQQLPANTTTVPHRLLAGRRYCYSVRTTDAVGQSSAWSAEACTGRPLDDRALAPATKGWTRGTGAAYYAGTFRKATRQGAALTLAGVQASELALVATTCPTCGKVKVTIGGQPVGSLSLRSATKLNQQVLPLPVFPFTTGTVKVKVTSAGKPVVVDGLAVSRG